MPDPIRRSLLRHVRQPAGVLEPMGPAQLRSWLQWVAPAAGFFAAVELGAGLAVLDTGLVIGSLIMAGSSLIAWTIHRRATARSIARLSTVLVLGLLVVAILESVLVPIGHATLMLVPFIAALLATSYARDRVRELLIACGVTAVLLAAIPEFVPQTSSLPAVYQAALRASSAIAASWLGLLLLVELAGTLSGALRSAARREREARAVFDNALDSIVTIDGEGTILTWNPQAEATFGWTAAEAVGRSLASTIVPPTMREAHERGVARLAATGVGRILNQRLRLEGMRRDGTLIPVELTVVPMELDGTVVYGGFVRDLSAELAVTERLATERRQRSDVAEALASIRSEKTPEATAAVLCRRIAETGQVSVAALYSLPDSGEVVPLAIEAPPGAPVAMGQPLPPARAAYLRERAAAGPWVEAWKIRPVDGDYGISWHEAGLRGAVYVPIRGRDGVVAMLIVGATEQLSHDELAELLPVAVEFAAVAGALLADELDARHSQEGLRREITTIMRRHAFDIVFQPVVELETGTIVGYEALTRFHDGIRPDVRFGDAARLGMGPALEMATARAALTAASHLPTGSWVSINMSPASVLDRRRMRRLLGSADRAVVVELTEHAAVADYSAIRRAIQDLGPNVRLAVDDAGAGYAGLRHLVELRAAIVKLDMRLVRHVDRDPARQALIAGMAHFAATSGCVLVAEGIETEQERAALADLGIEVGQGYLLGRPASVEAVRPRSGLRLIRMDEQAS